MNFGSDLNEIILATERLKALQQKQDQYALLRNEREKATFSMMMKMSPDALTNIRKEFFARRDNITLDEFIYIIQKHLVSKSGSETFVMETPDQREFGLNMYELFKDIDVNGDGMLEWQEFTSFTVEKANLLNKRAKATSIPHYHDSSNILDPSAKYRHRHDISKIVNLPLAGQFAMVEDHKNAIFVFNSRLGKHIATIATDSSPISIECVPDKDKEFLVTSGADMTLSTYSLEDPNPKRRYKVQSTWATPAVQMALAYAKDSNILYSGATNGNIYSWNVQKRNLLTTLTGHSDIVMNLIVLQKLNNVASASLDKTLGIWDSHTNEEILRLYGHKKGVFDLTYSPDYRLIFSCGFEHDACVWSPFVKSLVYRLKGHHSSLVGVQTVANTPELITADTSGVFKLWDIRNFQCVQTFSANLSGQELKDSSKLNCFFHTKLPSTNALQKEDDSRVFAASKMLFSYDQARVVHEATTDYTNVFWIDWNESNSVIITASEYNVIVWDALIGSRTFTHSHICGEEITACCLDDRKRKIVIGNISGRIGVYNYSNGALMKTVHFSNASAVTSLAYYDEGKRFIAGYANGLMCIYDERALEDCQLVRTFEHFNSHTELICLQFCTFSRTIATAGGASNVARLWDYDSGKCDTELHVGYDHSITIVSLTLLRPYPLIATSDNTGNIIIWGSQRIRWQGLRISGFINATPAGAIYEPTGRRNDGEEEKPSRIIAPPLKSSTDEVDNDEKIRILNLVEQFETAILPARQRGLRSSFNPLSEASFADETLKKKAERMAQQLIENSESKWGKVSAAQSLEWDLDNLVLFTGDDVGNLRAFDLSDVFEDIRAERLLKDHSHHKIKGLCRAKVRDDQSALPPYYERNIDDDFDAAAANYLLGQENNPMAYLGVKFKWSVAAHHDRIIYCKLVPKLGLLTSAADRLVKMWTLQGEPLGTLLQSVPVGTRSRSWDLVLDIDSIIQKENEELDQIIENALTVANDPAKPNIEELDFTGMTVGNESADFSQSVLRQRIEKSAKILGLDLSSNKNYLKDDMTISDQSVVSASSKSLAEALKELKSTDSAVDYELKTKQMSFIQQKRKANKLKSISKAYEEKTGVKIIQKDSTHNSSHDLKEEKEQEELDKFLISIASDDNSSVVNGDLYSISSLELPAKRSTTKKVVGSKISQSLQQAQDKGARTISIVNSCKKFKGYDSLTEALNMRSSYKEAKDEEIQEIRANREKKHKELMAMYGTSNSANKSISRSQLNTPSTPGSRGTSSPNSANTRERRKSRVLSAAAQSSLAGEKKSSATNDDKSVGSKSVESKSELLRHQGKSSSFHSLESASLLDFDI